jgi:hypothetical protein
MAANLAFSKVVATPTPTAWSQAYSAGSLFAAISLGSDTIPQTEEDNLNNLGKDLISTLESEFFTLETKDLESIKSAIGTTVSKLREDIKLSLVVCFLSDNILYLYAVGGGKAVLKRGEKIGTVLDGESGNDIKSASGYVQSKDVIILQTQPFIEIVPSSTLASSLDRGTPEEIAEELAPHVHEKSEGGASAVILTYKEGVGVATDAGAETGMEAAMAAAAAAGASSGEVISDDEEEISPITEAESTEDIKEPSNISEPKDLSDEEVNDEPISDAPVGEISEIVRPTTPMEQRVESSTAPSVSQVETAEASSPFLADQQPSRRMPRPGLGGVKGLNRSRRLIGLIVILLAIVIVIAGVLALTHKKSASNQAQFAAIYNSAKDKYDEAQSLKDLNSSLSQDSLKQAKVILEKNKDTFPQDSNEDQQIEALLAKVNSQLAGGSSPEASSTSATEVDKSQSKILSYEIDNPGADYFTQTDSFVYFLDGKGVNKIDKGNNTKTSIIDKSWKTEGGIGAFGSNIYVLDKADGVSKFVPSGSNFSKSSYFTGDAPDLSGTAAMGIDGSIYILASNGNITKYTKGAQDSFSVSGLAKPLSGPTRISTTDDDSNVYILDKGTSRIVVLDKSGKFQKAYTSDIIKSARDIDPQEANKKVYVLSNDKVYKIDL